MISYSSIATFNNTQGSEEEVLKCSYSLFVDTNQASLQTLLTPAPAEAITEEKAEEEHQSSSSLPQQPTNSLVAGSVWSCTTTPSSTLKEFIIARVFKLTGHENNLLIVGRSDKKQQCFQCTTEANRRISMSNRKCTFYLKFMFDKNNPSSATLSYASLKHNCCKKILHPVVASTNKVVNTRTNNRRMPITMIDANNPFNLSSSSSDEEPDTVVMMKEEETTEELTTRLRNPSMKILKNCRDNMLTNYSIVKAKGVAGVTAKSLVESVSNSAPNIHLSKRAAHRLVFVIPIIICCD